jgi:type IX secretion system PorP/SprF family membrane protein
MKKHCFSSVLISLLCLNCLAQDVFFNNSNATLLQLNPSFAGSNGGIRTQFAARNQSPTRDFRTIDTYGSMDLYLKSIKSGLAAGVMVQDQSKGLFRSNTANLTYARYISLKQGSIKIIPSVQVAVTERMVDLNSNWFVIDPKTGKKASPFGDVPSKTYFDFNSGVLANFGNALFLGLSVSHINRPNSVFTGTSRLNRNITLHGSYYILPHGNVILQLVAGSRDFDYQWVGLNAICFKYFQAGVTYLTGDNMNYNAGVRFKVFTIGMEYNRSFKNVPAYSYSYSGFASFNLRNKAEKKELRNFETF